MSQSDKGDGRPLGGITFWKPIVKKVFVMKVEKIDILWAVVSMFIVGFSYRRGELLKGLILIYAIMLVIFIYHILKVRRRISGSIAVYGTIVEYHTSRAKKKRYYPVLKYVTETGREITSVYTVEDRQKRYEIGDEELICYTPDDPMFFYFANRDYELSRDYFRFIVFGGVIAAVLAVIVLAE